MPVEARVAPAYRLPLRFYPLRLPVTTSHGGEMRRQPAGGAAGLDWSSDGIRIRGGIPGLLLTAHGEKTKLFGRCKARTMAAWTRRPDAYGAGFVCEDSERSTG